MIKNKKKKAFTLIELIIVIAVIAILAAIAIPKFGEVRKNAALKSDIANAKTIANAATALIAEERITVPATGEEIIVVDSTVDNEIEKYLQNPSNPQTSGYETYKVTIDNNGNVKVYMVSADSSKELFPNVSE